MFISEGKERKIIGLKDTEGSKDILKIINDVCLHMDLRGGVVAWKKELGWSEGKEVRRGLIDGENLKRYLDILEE